jgi:hypothetical protein
MNNVTPSIKPITEGQIGKLNQKITARLLKHKDELPSYLFQKALSDDKIIDEIFKAIHKRAGGMVKTIRMHGCEIEVILFQPAYKMYDHEVEEEYVLRELESLEHSLFVKFNREMEKEDPEFFKKFPNATCWENDDKESFSFAGFQNDNAYNGKVFSYGIPGKHGISSCEVEIRPGESTNVPCRISWREGYYDHTNTNERWMKNIWFAGVRKKASKK